MITITASDGTVTTMTEQEFRASRGTPEPARPRFVMPRRPKDYLPQGNGVDARFNTRGRRLLDEIDP